MWTASIATVLQRMLFLGAVLVAVAGSFGIRTILIADILSSLVVASFLAMRARAMLAGPLRASWKIIRLLVAQTAPLAMSFPLVFLYLRAEVFLVERGGQFAELGRLSAGTRLVDVFGLLPEMLIVSLFPLVVRHSGDPAAVTRYFRRVIQWLFLGLAPVAIGAWFFGPQLLVTALGSEYASSAPVFTLSAIALVFGFPMELATTFLIAVGQQRWRALIYAVLVVLTIAAGPGLVGHFGAVGAAGLRILTRVTGAAITIALVRYHRGGWIVPARAAILAAPAALVVSYTIGARVGLPWMVNAVTGALLYGFVATRLGLVPSVSYVWSSMSEWRTKQSRD
jgi:O-antigen/teichoic acid export membrane protein